MASVPDPFIPVRHGKCRLSISINGRTYLLRRIKPSDPASRAAVWRLISDGARTYSVCRLNGYLTCSCPDQFYHGAHCKHIRALQACGILSPRLKIMPRVTGEVINA